MAHLPDANLRTASRSYSAVFGGGSIASLAAHMVFIVAVAFAAALVLGLVP